MALAPEVADDHGEWASQLEPEGLRADLACGGSPVAVGVVANW